MPFSFHDLESGEWRQIFTPKTAVTQLIWMANGQHTVEVVAEDTAGYIATASDQLDVVGQAAETV